MIRRFTERYANKGSAKTGTRTCRVRARADKFFPLLYRLILFTPAVLSGSHAAVFPETLRQIALRGKSCKVSDIGNFMVGIFEEIFAYFDPAVGQVADR